jgi:hypothetical protein
MLNGHRNKSGHFNRSDRRTWAVKIPPEVVEPSLQKFWSEKYRFNISILGLNKTKARAWATRAVIVKVQTTEIELGCLSV